MTFYQTLVNTWIKRPSPKPEVSLVDDGQDDKKVGRVGVWCFWWAGNYVGEMDVENEIIGIIGI